MPRYGLPLLEVPSRALDAIEAAERRNARTVVLRDGQPIAAIVPVEDLDRIDPPDPGLSGSDPLMQLCGSCRRDAFVDQVLYVYGVTPYGSMNRRNREG